MARNSDDDGTKVPRNQWDFATEIGMELLRRLGPTSILVIGFLVAAYFLYSEINTARRESAKTLQASLDAAQQSLVENTKKMGEMSQTLLSNMNDTLNLSTRVNIEIDESRKNFEIQLAELKRDLDRSRASLESSEEKVEEARVEIDRLGADLEAKQNALHSLEDTHKSLRIEIAELNRRKEAIEQSVATLGSELDQARTSARTGGKQVALLEEADGEVVEIEDSGEPAAVAPSHPDSSLSEDAKLLQKVLSEFANDPDAVADDFSLNELLGISYDSIRDAVTDDGIGFSVWFRSEDRVFGFHKQSDYGPQNYVVFVLYGGRVGRTQTGLANVLFEIPRSENWYDTWTCDFVALRTGFKYDYVEDSSSVTISDWTQKDLDEIYYGEKVQYELLYGTVKRFGLASMEEVRSLFPGQFREWSESRDVRGRASVVLAMMARAKTFDSATIAGMGGVAFPDGMKAALERVLSAAVRRERSLAKDVIDDAIGQADLGAIAAMALRSRLEVVEVFQSPSSKLAKDARADYLVQFKFDPSVADEERGTATLVFSEKDAGWRLTSFEGIL